MRPQLMITVYRKLTTFSLLFFAAEKKLKSGPKMSTNAIKKHHHAGMCGGTP